MRDTELASLLFGNDTNVGSYTTSTNSALVPGRTRTYTALALSDSANGYVEVRVEGNAITDGSGSITLPTQAFVKAGDVVNVTVVNGVPIVTGAVGWGDNLSDTIIANRIETNELLATKATIESLNATNANVTNLQAETADIGTIRADSAKIHNLTADQLTAATAYIGDLTANSITAQDISATTGYIGTLTAGNITAQGIVADHATIGSLDSNYAQINLANVSNAWIDQGVIRNGAISNAMINSVSADKLTAGTIDAGSINVINLRTSNLVTDKINGQPVLGGYAVVDPSSSGYSESDPSALGWYEISNGAYVLSEDTYVIDGKTYYTYSAAMAIQLYDQAHIDTMEQQLNSRIDGTIQTWTGNVVPTLLNVPASDWSTNEIKMEHVGDIYYVLNASSDYDGFTYRFAWDNSTQQFMWVLIKDNQVTDALSRIGDLETFETTASGWMTNTDTELTTARGTYSSLNGRLSSDESAISTNSTNISTVTQTASQNESNITALTTITTNNGLTSSTNITNAVSTVTQTANTASTKISNLTTTLGTNSDGTTKDGDVVYRASVIEQGLSGLQSTVTDIESTVDDNLETIAGRISTLEQSSSGFSLTVANINSRINNLDSTLSKKASSSDLDRLSEDIARIDGDWLNWISYDGQIGALILGTSKSNIHAELDNDSLEFKNGSTQLAGFAADGMNVPTLRIGNWVFKSESGHFRIVNE